jgi:O-antigen biosynthesis protein WbqP
MQKILRVTQRASILFNLMHTPPLTWKRALDVSCCFIALPGLALVTIWVAVILRGSSSPIFLRQERAGPNGRRFYQYKFRTMAGGPHAARPVYGARWLRAFRLDELPKIINVLRGEMSFMDPSPRNSV